MKVNRILIYSLLLAGITITSCKDDNPSIDDYWLNYEIEEVKVTQDIPVGVYLYNPQNALDTMVASILWSFPESTKMPMTSIR